MAQSVEAAEVDGDLDPATPLITARLVLAAYRTAEADDTIRLYNGRFYRWADSSWKEFEDEAVRRLVYRFCETKMTMTGRGEGRHQVLFAPTKGRVNDILDALRAESHLSQTFAPPCWLDAHNPHPAAVEMLVCRNGLIHLPAFAKGEQSLLPPNPLFFNFNSLAFNFSVEAPAAVQWLSFLKALWPVDPESVLLLQEWFGYCLTCDTRQQKMLLIYGPKRCGKGTIARVLTALLGSQNVAGPTLGGLAMNFGLWPLLGKILAIISDARLSGRADAAIIIERLLSISGEDAITIDRKNLPPITVRLPTRVMMLTNELPKLSDASGAIASRFLILRLTESFYGKEDKTLEARLTQELPGILLWAIEG